MVIESLDVILMGVLALWIIWHFTVENPQQEETNTYMEAY